MLEDARNTEGYVKREEEWAEITAERAARDYEIGKASEKLRSSVERYKRAAEEVLNRGQTDRAEEYTRLAEKAQERVRMKEEEAAKQYDEEKAKTKELRERVEDI